MVGHRVLLGFHFFSITRDSLSHTRLLRLLGPHASYLLRRVACQHQEETGLCGKCQPETVVMDLPVRWCCSAKAVVRLAREPTTRSELAEAVPSSISDRLIHTRVSAGFDSSKQSKYDEGGAEEEEVKEERGRRRGGEKEKRRRHGRGAREKSCTQINVWGSKRIQEILDIAIKIEGDNMSQVQEMLERWGSGRGVIERRQSCQGGSTRGSSTEFGSRMDFSANTLIRLARVARAGNTENGQAFKSG